MSLLLIIKSLFLLLGIIFLSSFSREGKAWFWHCLASCLLEKWEMEIQKSQKKFRRNKNFLKQQDRRPSVPSLAQKTVAGGHEETLPLPPVSTLAPHKPGWIGRQGVGVAALHAPRLCPEECFRLSLTSNLSEWYCTCYIHQFQFSHICKSVHKRLFCRVVVSWPISY